jgi:5,10-methylenetetrahydromethanopterin reductase
VARTRTSARELGLGLQSDLGPEDAAEIGPAAEEAGLDVLSVYHDLFYPPAIAPLLWLAAATSRVRLGPAALNPFTLHPVEIAGQVAALDRASAGRAFLGLVRGAWLDRLALEEERPLTGLREAVEVVRRLLAGDRSGFAGERFALAPGAGLARAPVRPVVPLLVGTWGRRTAAWAGTVADEVKIGGSANPDLIPLVRGWIGNETTRIVVGCVSVVDEDAGWARARAAAVTAPYLEVVGSLDPTLELRAGQQPPLDRFAIAGTPREVAARVEELWAAGADRVELGTPQGKTVLDGIRLLGRSVVPHLRS